MKMNEPQRQKIGKADLLAVGQAYEGIYILYKRVAEP